jgi:hypothetical protein
MRTFAAPGIAVASTLPVALPVVAVDPWQLTLNDVPSFVLAWITNSLVTVFPKPGVAGHTYATE